MKNFKTNLIATLITFGIAAVILVVFYQFYPWAIRFNVANMIGAAAALFVGWFFGFMYKSSADGEGINVVGASVIAILLVLSIVLGTASGPMPNADVFASRAQIVEKTEEDVKTDLPTIENLNQISLMDTASAKKLGDRTLGAMKELVSQFEVSDTYYTIAYKGDIIKIAPLEYGGVFKAYSHEEIPGYVTVNVHKSTAKYNESKTGIVYSPSDYMSQDLHRRVQKAYPNVLLGNYTFQVDDEDNEFWVYQTMEYNTLMGCKVPNGCIVVAVDGSSMTQYSIEEAPEWVDLIFDGDYIAKLYDWYGRYNQGFWNFAKTGQTMTTDDFGYIVIDNTLYVYTGVTSVGRDESNIGFILCNTRNGQMNYYPMAGAEEYSAMSAAEGIVQNFGYKASFPSIVMVEDVATYVMVLKDDNGLVKSYAMVNYENYAIAVVGSTLEDCQEKYAKALSADTSIVDESKISSKEIVVKDIVYIANGGETTVYVYAENGEVFRCAFDEFWLLQEAGKTVTVKYVDSTDAIRTIVSFE